jgi:AcrR family transcriptional regulator
VATKSTKPRRRTGGDDTHGISLRPRDREVLEAAAAVFARKGYAAATVQDVAEELGILKGSLYYYIRTKEDLLFRIIMEVHAESDALLEEVKNQQWASPLAEIQEYVRSQTHFNLRNLVKISIYYNDLDQLSDERRAAVLARRKVHEDFIRDLIRQAQLAGEADDTRDAKLIAYSVFAVIIWPYRWYRPRGLFKAEDIVSACVDFITFGVAKR